MRRSVGTAQHTNWASLAKRKIAKEAEDFFIRRGRFLNAKKIPVKRKRELINNEIRNDPRARVTPANSKKNLKW